jgi:hypothetical protein
MGVIKRLCKAPYSQLVKHRSILLTVLYGVDMNTAQVLVLHNVNCVGFFFFICKTYLLNCKCLHCIYSYAAHVCVCMRVAESWR